MKSLELKKAFDYKFDGKDAARRRAGTLFIDIGLEKRTLASEERVKLGPMEEKKMDLGYRNKFAKRICFVFTKKHSITFYQTHISLSLYIDFYFFFSSIV